MSAPPALNSKPNPAQSLNEQAKSAPESAVFVILTLGLLLGLQPLATDLYLPALPQLQQGFGAHVSQAQLTLTGFLLAFGCSQILWGPLSDRLGRRPILLLGISGYVIAALGCASAQSMEALIAWRSLQGAALGAGVMCARAVVRDLYAPHMGAQVMSKALTGLGVLAFLAPISGSLLVGWLGWRSTMLAQAFMGGLAWLLVVLRFRESIPQRNPQALQAGNLLRTWSRIVRNPMFQAYNLLTCFSYAGLFTNLAASSFTYINVLHMERTQYGRQRAVLHRRHLRLPPSAAQHERAAHRGRGGGAVADGRLHHGLGGPGRSAQHLGLCPSLLSLPDRPRHSHALRTKQCHRTLPPGSGHGLGDQRPGDDADGFCHGALAGTESGCGFHHAAGFRHLVLVGLHCHHGMDAGTAFWHQQIMI